MKNATRGIQQTWAGKHEDETTIFDAVINAIDTGIVCEFVDGQVHSCNTSAERILGVSADQIAQDFLGPPLQIIHEDGSPFNPEEHPGRLALKSGKPCLNVEMGIHKSDGSLSWILLNANPLFQNNQKHPYAVVTSFHEITARKQTEEALRKSEQHSKQLLEAVTDYVYTVWIENECVVSTHHHPGCAAVTGYTSEEFEADPDLWSKMIHPDDREVVVEHAAMLLSGKKSSMIEHRIVHKNDSVRWVSNTPLLYKDSKGEVLFYEGIISDITQRKQAEEVVKTLSDAVRNTADIILITKYNGNIIYVNPAFEKKTGYTQEEIKGTTPRFLKSDQHDATFYKQLWHTILSGDIYYGTLINQKKNGDLYYEEKIISPIKDSFGKITYFVSTGRDITEKTLTEQKLKASLKEKEVLLQEIHHRVKNNLAIVSGFLELQAAKIKKPSILDFFQQAQNRIYSMALIHGKLYQSKGLARLEAKDFIQTLAEHLFSSYSLELNNISLKVEVDEVWLSIDEAIPCGLIMNELITNALKHAFPDGQSGEIQIILENLNNQCRLTVCDNGKGLTEALDIKNTDTLGLRLVNGLTHQLKGMIEIQRHHGTIFQITFPLSLPSKKQRVPTEFQPLDSTMRKEKDV